MKLLKVIMYNLASLEGEQVIDFESEPLRSADLFSIVGEREAESRPFWMLSVWHCTGLLLVFMGQIISIIIIPSVRTTIRCSILTTRVTFFARVRRSVLPKWCFWRATVSAIVPAGRVP